MNRNYIVCLPMHEFTPTLFVEEPKPMIPFDWKRELDRHDHRVVLSGQPVAIHCHHYNINLHKTLEDTLGLEGIRLIYKSAEEAIYYGIRELLSQYNEIRTVKSKLEMAAIMYQNCGLGVIHPQGINERGGSIVSPSSHHVTGWLAKHGRRNTPGCHFSCGWIAGMVAAIHDKPVGHYQVTETKCKTMRDAECVFEIKENLNEH
ncbi:MAG: 4-vinyl reductase [Desulfatirhabdiaceae bacterium]